MTRQPSTIFGIVAVVVLVGCGTDTARQGNLPVVAAQQTSPPSQRGNESADQVFANLQEQETKLASLTNTYGRPEGSEPLPKVEPNVNQAEMSIDLTDLGLVFRFIKLTKPIDKVSTLYASETEVTNNSYAIYLSDTNQYRDDTALAEASKIRRVFSTASISIQIHDEQSLWREGRVPQNRELYPVAFLTIRQAAEFCDWLNKRYELKGHFRLPTEAEWLFCAYGEDRDYPWGNEPKRWTDSTMTHVKSRPDLKTPDGLYGIWGNVTELVISPWNGYGGKTKDVYSPTICKWLGAKFYDENIRGSLTKPRQDDWGYTHSINSRDDEMGFRVVFIPSDGLIAP